MEHLPLGALALVFELLTAHDVAHLTAACSALHPLHEPNAHAALALVVKRRWGVAALANLREDDARWPRSAAVLRAAEVLSVKKWLGAAQSTELATAGVFVSKAWLLAWRRRCQHYEQFLLQFRLSKKKQQQRERRQQTAARAVRKANAVAGDETAHVVPLATFDTDAAVTRDAGRLIVCPHGEMLPAALCVGRLRRVVVSNAVFKKLALYAPDVRGFPLHSPDCWTCVQEREAKERETELLRQSRFEAQIAGSNDLLDLLLRKSGYPNELFSPASTRGSTHLSLNHCVGKSYFLVPKKWLVRWREFVRSVSDEWPGPVLNAELVCLAHQRNVVPPYITMFLSGFSIEQSLQASQALGTSASKQYEIVTLGEWEALHNRYCSEYAVGFAVYDGSYHWQTPECNICHYGMGSSGTERRNSSR
ncbi:hypothetical protein PybrP1_007516 [[Pythium] brassicae (nom. inval.)]|nr:hypothetical protein PybrP1_007516 [[Pythium] brassicae (nom. inval.)]